MNIFTRRLHDWLIPYDEYIRVDAVYYTLDEMFVSLSMWHSIRSAVVSVFQYWIDTGACEKYDEHYKFDLALAQKLIATSNNPETQFVTLQSGEQVEVLKDLNYKILEEKLSPWQ